MVDHSNNTFGTYTTERSRSPSYRNIQRDPSPNAANEVLDRKFVSMMLEIEKRYQADEKLQKHDKIRIEQWVSKFKLFWAD